MAQITPDLVRSVLNGAGATRGELEQLCHFYLAHAADYQPPADDHAANAAAAIHYPDCWDDVAYPTAWDAMAAVYEDFRCTQCTPADDQARRDAESKYQELLYSVATVHPGESRHETALRYIRNAEAGQNRTAQAASAAEGDA